MIDWIQLNKDDECVCDIIIIIVITVCAVSIVQETNNGWNKWKIPYCFRYERTADHNWGSLQWQSKWDIVAGITIAPKNLYTVSNCIHAWAMKFVLWINEVLRKCVNAFACTDFNAASNSLNFIGYFMEYINFCWL